MVTPGSRLVGSTIRRVNFMRQYGSMVLGLKRRAHMIRNRITEIPLRIGDTMLDLRHPRTDQQPAPAARIWP